MGVQVTVWPRGRYRVRSSGPFGITYGTLDRRVGKPLFADDYGELVSAEASTRYEPGFGGHDLASWTVKPHGGYVGGLMRPGDHVRITKGGGIVFDGEFSEAEPGSTAVGSRNLITLHAKGYAYNLYDYDSIYWNPVEGDDVYYPTTKLGAPDDDTTPLNGWGYAVTELGMPINKVIGLTTSLWTNPFGESDMAEAPIKLGDLITAIHQEAGERWAVWGRTLFLGPDETEPKWSYAAPDGVFGVADTNYATHVWVWFVSTDLCSVQPWLGAASYGAGDTVSYDGRWWRAKISNSGVTPVEGSTWTEDPTAYRRSDFSSAKAVDSLSRLARFDTRTAYADYRGLGPMLSARASELAGQLLQQVKGRFILSGSFTVGPDSGFATADGGIADIAFVRAGQVLKMPGLRTDQGNLMDSDTTIIGQTQWSWSADGSETQQITPMGAVPRSLSEILRGAPLDSTSIVSGSKRTRT